MNKILKNIFINIFIAILLLIPCVVAYDTNNLKAYYSFDNSNISKIIDLQNNYNLSIGSSINYVSVTGKFNNSLYHNGTILNSQQYNTTIFNIYNNSFSINFWLIHNASTNTDYLISIKNDSSSLFFNIRFLSGNISIGTKGSSSVNEILTPIATSQSFNMITVTYDGIKTLKVYINGDFSNSNNNITFRYNSSQLYYGIPYYDTIDELSIFNSELTIFDVNYLYNSGLGQNYSNTKNYNSSNLNVMPLCIDNNNLCNNPVFISNSYYCDVLSTSYCADGCINLIIDNTTKNTYVSTYNSCNTIYTDKQKTLGLKLNCNDLNINIFSYFDALINPLSYFANQIQACNISLSNSYYTIPYSECNNTDINTIIYENPTHQYLSYGVCSNNLCQNDCNILGYQECSSTTSFKICGNYDTDNCLEYSGDFGCLGGQLCSNGYCVTNHLNGTSNNSVFTVIPYSTSDSNTNYNLDNQKKILTVDTKNLAHTQKFNTNTQTSVTYSSRTCNYKETNVYNMTTPTIVYTTLTPTVYHDINLSFTPIGNTLISNISITPTNLNNVTIILRDSFNNIIEGYLILINSSQKQYCIYDYDIDLDNSTLYGCIYSINSYDDLNSINIESTLEFQSQTISSKFIFNTLQPQYFVTNPEYFNKTDFNKIDFRSINATINSVVLKTITQPKPFSLTLRNNYEYLPCIYTTIGCNLVRTYNNNNGISDFSNYYDYTICISSLNNNNPTQNNDSGFFNNLSVNMKYFIMIICSLLVVIIMTILMSSFGDGLSGLLVGLVMSMITSLTLTIIFNLTLLIPILYILVGGAICAMLIRRIFAG